MTNCNSTYPISGSELELIQNYTMALITMSDVYAVPESMRLLIEDLADEAEALKNRSLIQSKPILVNG